VLVANFDVTDSGRLNAFREKYNVPAEVPVFGPYEGRLANDADEIELKRPDNIQAFPDTIIVSIMVEQVDYTDEAPWPESADGTGASLQRVSSGSYANDPGSWVAVAPSAGRAAAPGTAPTITSQPQAQTALATASVNFNVSADGSGPLRYQWRRDGQNIAEGTNSVLTVADVRPEDAGQYSVTVYNDAGATVSSNATLTVNFGAYIFTQPASTNCRPNQTAHFSISAFTESTLTYQWRFNGENIPGANASSYTINSVQLSDHGIYDVVLTDQAGTLVSEPALLQVLINPIILQQPLSQTVPRGGSATLSILLTNTATLPIEYRWRVNSRNTRTNILNRRYDFFTISNVVGTSNINIGLVNVGGSVLSALAAVTPINDFDADGMPDAWEVVYGFDTNNPADASQDFDLDTANNRDEYIAGTDPSDPQSYLKVNSAVDGGEAVLTFQAISNRTYGLLSVDALGAPWTTLAPVIARTNNRVETVTDPVAGQNQRFYRLVTPYLEP
jgi:hypothetical protein